VVAPDIGGRIMAFNLDPYAYLWVNRNLSGQLYSPVENQGNGSLSAWKNYGGSKTWPAPQGWDTEDQWHGPPDSILDTGRYTFEEMGSADGTVFIHMQSGKDSRTGVQIVRHLTLHPGCTHATLHLEMVNISEKPRRWGIWEVVQLDAARQGPAGETHNDQAGVYIPSNPVSVFQKGYRVMFGAQDNPEWKAEVSPSLIGVQYQYLVGKIDVDSTAGWVAFVNQVNDFAFIQCFSYHPGETYPDGGATVECWTTGLGESVSGLDYSNNPMYHVEAEVLGPLRVMQPGERQSFDIQWYAVRCPGPIIHVTPAGCCHQALRARVVTGGLRLTGVYGVFYPGDIYLKWKNDAGELLRMERVALANPMVVLRIDLVQDVPEAAVAVELVVVDPGGAPIGEIDSASLP